MKNLEISKLKHDENSLREQGYNSIIGVDEAGRGPLAGPVVAAAVMTPKDFYIKGVDDSKKLTEKKREEIFNQVILDKNLHIGIGIIEPSVIDEINILQATFVAMKNAISQISKKADLVLFDGSTYPLISMESRPVIKGDQKYFSIALASIIAKYKRDEIMKLLHEKHPEYFFDKHKGYGTKKHIEMIHKHGPTKIHRFSFEPIKSTFKRT